ncbi:MAG: EAL domain-containing protein [Alphaproteobacteria bacterium]
MSAALSTTAESDLLASLFERLPYVLGINLAIAICAVIAFSISEPPGLIMLWIGTMLASLAFRLKVWRDFARSAGERRHEPAWTQRFTLAAGLNGGAWGLAPVLFYNPDSLVAQTFLPFVLAGMSGGSLVGLSGSRSAFFAFYISLATPYALRLVWEGDQAHLTMAAAVVIYMVGIGWLGRSFNGYLRQSVRLAGENEHLLTALRQRTAELQEKSSQLEVTFEHINQGVAVFDQEHRLVTCNHRHRELCSDAADAFLPGVDSRPGSRPQAHREPRREGVLKPAEPARHRCRNRRFDWIGTKGRFLQIEDNPMPSGGFVRTSTDVTDRKRHEAHILHLAQHDSLTGLPNRMLFHDRLDQALHLAQRKRGRLAVLLLDLDRFKTINDTLGHDAGDRLLQQTSERLRACIRGSDMLARLGGDEFVIIQMELRQKSDADVLAERIKDAFREGFDLGGQHVHVGTSIGIAIAAPGRQGPESAGELLRHADLALYQAKFKMRGGHCFFEEGMNARIQRRKLLEHDLRAALTERQLELHYQPQLDLRTGRMTGVEALLRWHHPKRGLVPPADFIPLAEESDLIVAIGEWVLGEACAQAAAWPSLTMAVNLSPIQFMRSDLVETVETVLARTGLPAARLELEITESAWLADCDKTMATLNRLRDLGVRVALDDFGTGYASISYLLRFPFDKIKIDRSFIQGLDRVTEANAVVHALIGLGRSIGMRASAEGVETPAQIEHLRKEGCEEVQGFYYGEPVLAQKIGTMLANSHRHFIN